MTCTCNDIQGWGWYAFEYRLCLKMCWYWTTECSILLLLCMHYPMVPWQSMCKKKSPPTRTSNKLQNTTWGAEFTSEDVITSLVSLGFSTKIMHHVLLLMQMSLNVTSEHQKKFWEGCGEQNAPRPSSLYGWQRHTPLGEVGLTLHLSVNMYFFCACMHKMLMNNL